MRRALLLLLAILLPLKAIGAAVVPITGAPHHHHATSHHLGGHEFAGAAEHQVVRAPCSGMSHDVDADAGVVHEHSCPHLGMLTLVPTFVLPQADRRVPAIEPRQSAPLRSVVLPVLVPPPTVIS
jgi:hypothetical protein